MLVRGGRKSCQFVASLAGSPRSRVDDDERGVLIIPATVALAGWQMVHPLASRHRVSIDRSIDGDPDRRSGSGYRRTDRDAPRNPSLSEPVYY